MIKFDSISNLSHRNQSEDDKNFWSQDGHECDYFSKKGYESLILELFCSLFNH